MGTMIRKISNFTVFENAILPGSVHTKVKHVGFQ